MNKGLSNSKHPQVEMSNEDIIYLANFDDLRKGSNGASITYYLQNRAFNKRTKHTMHPSTNGSNKLCTGYIVGLHDRRQCPMRQNMKKESHI